jgi:hypothetical protein
MKNSTMSFDSQMPTGETMNDPAQGEPMEKEAPEMEEESPETMQMDISAFPKPPKVGDKVPMEVVSVDQENGTATVKCCAEKSMGGGIAKAAGAFDE